MKIERRELLDCVQVEDLSLVEYVLFILFLCLYVYMNPHVFARNFGKGDMRLVVLECIIRENREVVCVLVTVWPPTRLVFPLVTPFLSASGHPRGLFVCSGCLPLKLIPVSLPATS